MTEGAKIDGFEHGTYWQEVVEGDKIPGSTRVPVFEISRHFASINKEVGDQGERIIVDLGSGSGRSTEVLQKSFPGVDVVALDLSLSGLQQTEWVDKKIAASVDSLPLADSSVDVFSMCGVMTNLVDRDPEISKEIRKKTAQEIKRCLKEGGMCVISDFVRPHNLSGYPADYGRHSLITNEEGTIAVFDPSKKITFKNLSDGEVEALTNSPDLQRFAHHYKPEELIKIFQGEGLKATAYSIEIGNTPSGTPIDTIILSVVKEK